MKVSVDRIVVSGLSEPPAAELGAELRRELSEALAGARPARTGAVGDVEAEVAAGADVAGAIAAAVRDALGGPS
jgi:hypothetical protein